ncbi:MAG: tyrosine-protein phosphatase [Rubrivivax sp.]|nr:tyrosine-protein phosphatase [Pyrinomonadaceae bacterium]
MKERFSRCIAVTVALFCMASVGLAQSEPKYKELPNFHQVNERLYRGAQPKRGGISRLAQLGIKTIVNLRPDDERSQAEEQEARAAGLRYFNMSVEKVTPVGALKSLADLRHFNTPFNSLGRPTDEQVERVLAIINAPENQPVFVHCKRGADRTGTIIAIYRIEHDGWTSERAKAEANRYGMAWWERGKKDYIRDYYRRRLQRTVTDFAPGVVYLHRAD